MHALKPEEGLTLDELRRLMAAITQPVLLVEFGSRRIAEVNPAVEHELGFKREELIDRPTHILHADPELFAMFGRIGDAVLGRNEPFTARSWMKRRDGEIVASEHLVTPVRSADGRGLHLSFLTLRDWPDWVALYHKLKSLTRRELEILRRTLTGDSAKGIALALDISHRTVESHRASMLRKFEVSSTAELLSQFVDGGLMD